MNNDLGNLVSRVHAMTGRYFEGKIPKANELTEVDNKFVAKLNIFEKFNNEMNNVEINKATETLFTAIRDTNAYVNETSPWKETDGCRLETIMNVLCSAIKMFTKYLFPFIPEKVERMLKQYNFEMPTSFSFDLIDNETTLGEKDNLFEKIKKEEKVEEKVVEREGFSKLALKIGQVSEVKKHVDSDKLYIIQVDLGNEKRQIVSGLQTLYTLEELENKKVVVITNLKAAKLGGVDSDGMILACEDEEGHCGLLTSELEVGTYLSCDGKKGDNDKQIKSKAFKKVEMFGKSGKVICDGKEVIGIGVDKDINGKVC